MKIKNGMVLFFTGKDFPSQWYPCKFFENNIKFYNAEQYMMYHKAILFHDFEIANQILKNPKPNEVKMLGRNIKNFNENVWNKVKVSIVTNGNILKFTQNSDLREKLITHKDKIYVEASPYDKIWGCGLREESPRIFNKNNWTGQNLLGEILTNLAKDLADI